MQTLTQTKSTVPSRPWFIGACALGSTAFLALLAYCFARYPDTRLSTSTGPKAVVPQWFGANGAGIAYMLLGLLIVCLYLYVSIQGTAVRGMWRTGVLFGVAIGVLWLIAGILGAFVQIHIFGLLVDAALLVLPILSGAFGASQTGRFGSGPLAGFWCGLAAALLIAIAIVSIDLVFANHFLQTTWAQDGHCNLHTGDALVACEVSDDLGFAAMILVAFPVVMAGLGAIGGAIGVATTHGRTLDASSVVDNSRAPLIFSALMIVLLVSELTLNLW